MLLAVGLALAAPAPAESRVIMDNKQQETVTLQKDETLQVLGNQNQLTVLGNQGRVAVAGNQNQLTLKASGGACEVTGNANQITVDGSWAKLDVLGNKNQIRIVKRPGQADPVIRELGKDTQIVHVDP